MTKSSDIYSVLKLNKQQAEDEANIEVSECCGATVEFDDILQDFYCTSCDEPCVIVNKGEYSLNLFEQKEIYEKDKCELLAIFNCTHR